MPLQEVERRTMWVSVWHSDMFGRNDFLGEVRDISKSYTTHVPPFYSKDMYALTYVGALKNIQ
jgi:hypothetical protein